MALMARMNDPRSINGRRATRRRELATRAVLVIAVALTSAVLTWMTSDPLFVTGTTAPLPVWGPTVSDPLVSIVLAACILGIVLAPGWRWRLTTVLVWVVALGVLTHRVVDGQEYGPTYDQWLGLEAARIGTGREGDPAPAHCAIGLVPALCITRGGHRLRTPTLVPFAQMIERAGAPDRLTTGAPTP